MFFREPNTHLLQTLKFEYSSVVAKVHRQNRWWGLIRHKDLPKDNVPSSNQCDPQILEVNRYGRRVSGATHRTVISPSSPPTAASPSQKSSDPKPQRSSHV